MKAPPLSEPTSQPVYTYSESCSPIISARDVAPEPAAPHSETIEESNEPTAKRVEVEADEIVFRAGNATITMKKADGGIVEIHAPNLKLTGDNVLSEATNRNTVAGRKVVCEAISVADLLGKLVRVDGQCVKIS